MARSTKKKLKLADLPAQADARASLDSALLLAAAQPLLKQLDADLYARAKESPSVTTALQARHAEEKAAERTADGYAQWLERFIGQVGAAWLLSCVFVRTLEDRGLLDQNRIAGPGAADSQRLFFSLAPSLTERDYLLMVFRELLHHPAARALFDARHNPVWLLAPSAEAAKALLALFRTPDADAPALRFGQASTRFLGDLYQDLDEGVRKRFALLQTPDFVERFILDRTLEPAIEKFGLEETNLIDPTCGSGHFLLGAFDRLFEHRLRAAPGTSPRQLAHDALDKVFGADINPYAVAIAKFRLTLSFLEKASYSKLSQAPRLPLHVAVADSLLYNPQHEQASLFEQEGVEVTAWEKRAFALEDEPEARAVLGRQYAAVVGNPPYITVKDKVLRDRYRALYPSAFREYSLSVPFAERFFQLARRGGRVGQITANSFMKREFGKKLIQDYLPSVNLDLIVNTSGAYIPGHGTPTVMLFGSHEPPLGDSVLAVLAKRGEPSTPSDPARGLVWASITEHWSDVGFDGDFVSVELVERQWLQRHPWVLPGGGGIQLFKAIESTGDGTLGVYADAIGFSTITGEDNVLLGPSAAYERQHLKMAHVRRNVVGEEVRDWSISPGQSCVWPNTTKGERLQESDIADVIAFLWPYRVVLKARKAFGVPVEKKGIPWWALREVYKARMQTPLTITFAFVATHNHFVLDRGGKVFNRSAPIIKLPADATEEDHLALLAYLNSSTACFWMKQVCHNKGQGGVNEGLRSDIWDQFHEFSGTHLKALPLPPQSSRQLELASRMLTAAERLQEIPAEAIAGSQRVGTDEALSLEMQWVELQETMVALQEQLDWQIYVDFGLLGSDALSDMPMRLRPGSRPFEFLMHESDLRGVASEWFRRNKYSEPDARFRLPQCEQWIDSTPELQLMERPEHKRPWRFEAYQDVVWRAARSTIAQNLERIVAEAAGVLTLPELRCRMEQNQHIIQLLSFDHEPSSAEQALERSLVKICESSVPYLAAYRHTDSGMTRRAAWERTWELQAREDAGEDVGAIPVPPKYESKDFLKTSYWRLRGKLDVPKERFISYPGCESDEDKQPIYGWAGWDHEQRAKALATLYWNRKNEEAWPKERLTPMLAGLLELLFWLDLWHAERSDDYAGDTPAKYYKAFLATECQALGLTHENLRSWRPPKKAKKKRAAKKPAAAKAVEE